MKISELKRQIEVLREIYNFNDDETEIRIKNFNNTGAYYEQETIEISTDYNNVHIHLLYQDRESKVKE